MGKITEKDYAKFKEVTAHWPDDVRFPAWNILIGVAPLLTTIMADSCPSDLSEKFTFIRVIQGRNRMAAYHFVMEEAKNALVMIDYIDNQEEK